MRRAGTSGRVAEKSVGDERAQMKLGFACLLFAAAAAAQTPSGPVVSFTATTDNIADAHDSIRIDVLRWSTDAERDELIDAWNLKTPPPTQGGGRGGRGGGGGGGRGAAGGAANGGAAPAAAQGNAGAAAAAAGGRGGAAGRGGRGGGGRGRGGAGGGAEAAPRTPETSLAAELEKAPTVGYVWSSEVAGYSIRYAAKMPEAGGGERIILITDRRLGSTNDLWKPAGTATISPYEFSLIELHVNAKGEGEGKTSLTGKLAVDSAAKTMTLENYADLPVILAKLKQK